MATKAVAWTGRYWSTVAMLGVAMFSLVVLRSVVNSKPEGPKGNAGAQTSPLTLHVDEDKSEPAAAGDTAEADRPRLRLKKGHSLKDDLVEIVRVAEAPREGDTEHQDRHGDVEEGAPEGQARQTEKADEKDERGHHEELHRPLLAFHRRQEQEHLSIGESQDHHERLG